MKVLTATMLNIIVQKLPVLQHILRLCQCCASKSMRKRMRTTPAVRNLVTVIGSLPSHLKTAGPTKTPEKKVRKIAPSATKLKDARNVFIGISSIMSESG